MKKSNLIKIRWLLVFSICASGLVSSNEQWPTNPGILPGDTSVYFSPINKTEFHGFQPRMGEQVQIVRRQRANNSKNTKKMARTDHTQRKSVVQAATNGQQSMDIPILIYRGPNRPMEPYRPQAKLKNAQLSRYVGSASKLVKNQENNSKLSHANKSGKSNSNTQITVANPRSSHGQKSKMKGMYEDISILQQPINVSSKGRKTAPYTIPERQNFDIHSGGMYEDDSESDTSQILKSEPKSDDVQYSDISAPKPRNRPESNAKVFRRKLYSRNYDQEMITPPNYDFDVMDHYDGGFSLPKPKRESPQFGSRSYYGPGTFGVEFDYDNYDFYDSGYSRPHRSSNLKPEYNNRPIYESDSNPVVRPSGNRRRNQRPRRRQRQGQAVATGTNTNSGQTAQVEADDRTQNPLIDMGQGNGNLPRSSVPRRRPKQVKSTPIESNIEPNSFATSAAIESTYANVEIRRTSPRRLNTSLRQSGNERLRTNRRLRNEQGNAHRTVPQTYDPEYQQQ